MYYDDNDRENAENKTNDNGAEKLNEYLFAKEELSSEKLSYEGDDRKSSRSVLKIAGLLILVMAIAFTGAFSGMYWICRTALTSESDLLSTIILKMSGVKVNKTEVDYISGEYVGDGVTLAEKIMKSSLAIACYTEDESTGKYTLSVNGSGVILSAEGLAVSNRHVVYGADRVYATDCNGKEYKCEVIAVDEKTDLALIKLDIGDETVTPVTVADSSKAVMGQNVAVVGNPLGVGLSYSYGYVSHPDRDISDEGGNFIQIDVTVNPGNSGGGLFDAQGNLLGIVTAKAKGDYVDGIGYAIPSNRMISVINDLMQHGYVKGRPALGLTIATVNSSNWQTWNQKELKGLLGDRKYGVFVIESKYTDELKLGDRIVTMNGVSISENADISAVLAECKVGDEVILTIERPVKGDDGLVTYEPVREVRYTLRERDWADDLK